MGENYEDRPDDENFSFLEIWERCQDRPFPPDYIDAYGKLLLKKFEALRLEFEADIAANAAVATWRFSEW
jgi:hypothetical protein